MAIDTLRFDGAKLARIASMRGLLRGDIARLAEISSVTQAKVFDGKPVNVVTARKIAEAINVPLHKPLSD